MGWVCWWSWTPAFPPWRPTSLGCPVHTPPTSFMCYSVSNYTYMRIQHAYYTIEYKSWHNHPPLSTFHLGLFLEIYRSLLLGGLKLNFGGLTWVLGCVTVKGWHNHPLIRTLNFSLFWKFIGLFCRPSEFRGVWWGTGYVSWSFCTVWNV